MKTPKCDTLCPRCRTYENVVAELTQRHDALFIFPVWEAFMGHHKATESTKLVAIFVHSPHAM